jgi:hypothetical protein
MGTNHKWYIVGQQVMKMYPFIISSFGCVDTIMKSTFATIGCVQLDLYS